MKLRTIQDINDKEIGHKRFAQFVNLAINNGYAITNIKEYNEKFKFDMSGFPMEFDKMNVKDIKWYFNKTKDIVELRIKLYDLEKNI